MRRCSPACRRTSATLVTFHDAFGYFAARYDLELLGFIVESPEEQPSASAYAELVDAIVEFEVPYIYTEPQFDARVVEQLADETGAGVRVLPSGTLSEDYPDYVTFMRTIAERIAG
ncbi:MAG: metal ABC transporter substrate-binding protein [Dehalococcoidia bacterium]|nr:metal ABC transporter substrate-binding protein [Dehalococcoidia bacterium]